MLPSRPSNTTREFLRLYALASRDERNLAHFLGEHPELVAHLAVPLDLEQDDVEIALQLASTVGHYKRRTAALADDEHAERAAAAVRQLVATTRNRGEWLEVDPELLLGDLLVDKKVKYVSFELAEARVPVLRTALARARSPLRNFIDTAASIDTQGVHLRWRGGRGGLNFHPQVEERGAHVLHVDLRPRPSVRRRLPRPLLLADVLADLGLI